eukprot:3175009-Prymnesium_polylepis.1
MIFWRSGGTCVSAYSCALKSSTGAAVSSSTFSNFCLPHLTVTVSAMASVSRWVRSYGGGAARRADTVRTRDGGAGGYRARWRAGRGEQRERRPLGKRRPPYAAFGRGGKRKEQHRVLHVLTLFGSPSEHGACE